VTPELDVVVVGAGVLGLAAGAALAGRGRRVVVLERHGQIAQETSSRNSQVIHAGIYYPPGSEKARLCVAGRERLYERCRRLGIGHRQLGKVIVATEVQEIAALEALLARGRENGAPGLEILDRAALARREPQVRAVAALYSPRTGIVDADAVCLSFAAELEAGGGTILPRAELVAVEAAAPGFRLRVRGPDGALEQVSCAALVNAAGLESDHVAALAGLDVDALGYRIHPCKGDYFAVAPGAPLRTRGLVYPVPGGPGLGIHVTRDLGGRVRLGPDASYVDRAGYRVDPAKAEPFAAAVGRFLPGMRPEWLTPDGAGIRPKLSGPGEGFRDFVVREETDRGLPGLVDLIGIESPGLTAAPAIGERVAQLLRGI
jgi:L-2-hydroxyglutarate oxidase LhgO